MNVLVTGGKGFIGSAVCAALRARGHRALVLDRTRGHDVRHIAAYDGIESCDGVIHLAGILGTSELFDTPEQAVDTNVKGTLAVLDACRIYGMSYVGITMPPVWANVYTATKLCSTNLASAWHRHHGVKVSHVRAFNVYGPGQKYGEGHPQKIIPTFSTLSWANRPLPVWGSGGQTVDLIHLSDVAKMLVDALAFGNDDTFDAGTGHAITVNEVATLVNGVTGSTAGIDYLPMRKGEDPETKIVAEGEGWDKLGWSPRFSESSLAEVVRGYRCR